MRTSFSKETPSRPLRDSLQVLEPPKTRLKSCGDRSFAYGAVVEYNMLPLHTRHSPSVEILPSNRQTYLFLQNSKYQNWKLYEVSTLFFYLLLSTFVIYQSFYRRWQQLFDIIQSMNWLILCSFVLAFFLLTVMYVIIIDLLLFIFTVYISFSMIHIDYCAFTIHIYYMLSPLSRVRC